MSTLVISAAVIVTCVIVLAAFIGVGIREHCAENAMFKAVSGAPQPASQPAAPEISHEEYLLPPELAVCPAIAPGAPLPAIAENAEEAVRAAFALARVRRQFGAIRAEFAEVAR